MTARDGQTKIGYADMVAFVCELAMFPLVIASVNYLVVGWRSWLIGIAAAIAGGPDLGPVDGAELVAPAHRSGRYVAQAALFVSIGALAAVSGLLWLGVVFTVTSLVAFAFSRTEQHG